MFYIIGAVLLIVLVSYVYNHKLVIRIDTFFRKGFKKLDDKYGVYTFVGKQRRPVRR